MDNNLVKFKNKATGLYMMSSRYATKTTTYNFVATAFDDMPSQYRIRTSDITSFSVAWYSAANGNYIDTWGASTSNSQIAWYFIVEPSSAANYDEMYFQEVKRDLATNITAARAAITNTSTGDEPGQFTENAVADLEAFIEVAQIIYDTETSIESFQMTIDELKKAVKAYLATALMPVISDETTTRWYFLQGTRPSNTYMTYTGDGLNVVSRTVIPDSTQMWKFVANTLGTGNGIAIVNKATCQYLNADIESGSLGTILTSVSGMPANNLKLKVSDLYTDKRACF